MNFNKRVNGSWVDIPHYIHNTSTDTITTLPADIYPNAVTATVGLKGNMSQTGSPTPDNPIMPQGTGERSINLTPNQKITSSSYSYTVTTHPLINALKNITPNENYTLSWEFSSNGSGGVSNRIRLYTSASGTMIKILQPEVSFTLTSEEIANLGALFCYFGGGNTDGYMDKFMLVEGSTAKDYEPYGYKIPISSANTTTPVYLGEVHTTRKVKKYECTGDENWRFFSDSTGEYGAWQFYVDNAVNGLALSSALSNIAEYGATASTRSRYPYGVYLVASGTGIAFQMAGAKDIFPSVTAWKFYLAQQYANGTPVTVWYVLATPETAVVNEPLRKIGNYADEVSGITIPTIAGANTLSVDTTLQPSEVSVNYKGWHPVADVHEYDSNYTIATMQALTIAQLQTHTISELQGGEWS